MSSGQRTRAQRAGDAAIDVLAEHGARGLTHRAVDQAAGLPPGTTSNYARTRSALLALTLTRISELDAQEGARGLADWSSPGDEGLAAGPSGLNDLSDPSGLSGLSGEDLAAGLARIAHRMLTEETTRRRALARFELAFEATRRPELRAAYDEMGRAFRDQAARFLAAAGSAAPDRDAWTLIAWLEGTAFYALAGAGGSTVPSQEALRYQLSQLVLAMTGS